MKQVQSCRCENRRHNPGATTAAAQADELRFSVKFHTLHLDFIPPLVPN
jgi:hypothetical protein